MSFDLAATDTPSFEFGILGPLQVRRGGADVPVGARKQRAVLAMLLLEAGNVVPTGRLIEEVWQGRPPPSAAVTLRSYVSRLRTLLRPDVDVIARAGGYALKPAAVQVDAQRFEQLVREGEDALARGLARSAAQRFRTGLALWRGEALADVADGGLLVLEGSRLEGLRLSAVEGRIEAELALGLHAELVAELERMVGEHPFRERLWRQLMLALYRCDRQADALAAYAQARETLTAQLGLEPSEELRRLQQAVLQQTVPVVRRAVDQDNLPGTLSSFIGRERELEDLARLLRETRLLTVTGVGGVGKTRLAIEAAAQAAPRVERVCFIDLSEIREPALVAHATAEALGVTESPHRPLEQILTAYVRATEPLLVLDNCEHVRDGAAQLVECLVAAGPALHVLATSREPLGVPGEVDYTLSPLAVPTDDLDAKQLAQFPSVLLFLERASAARGDFAATDGAIASIASICRELDGLPLAIELAAVRAKTLAAEEIAANLEHRFDFLKFWRRIAVPRHQTLRATMDWSYELLSEQERQTLRRSSVFAGGFTLAACAQVCTEDDEGPAMDLLARLVDRSLVVAQLSEGGSRYRLLETVRQYAAERLAEAGEAGEARRAHAMAFLRLAEVAFSPDQDGMSVLAQDQANLRAALEWSFSGADEIAPQLTAALGRFWLVRWQLGEARLWLERALSQHRAADELRARLLGILGDVLFEVGDLKEAVRVLSGALRIAESAGDSSLAARIRVRQADVRLMLGAISAREALVESEAAAAALEIAGDTDALAGALATIGKFRFWVRDRQYRETLERAAELGRQSGNRAAELSALEWLAVSYIELNIPTDVAIQHQEKLLERVTGEPRFEAGILAPMAWLYGMAGRFTEAHDALARSRAIYAAELGWPLEWAGCAMNAGAIELMAGDPVAAEQALRPAYDALRAMGEAFYLKDVAYYLTRSLCEQGRGDEALQVLEGMRSSLPPGSEVAEGDWQLAAARVKAARGELRSAERLAREGRRRVGTASPIWVAEAALTQAEVLEVAGKPKEAAAAFRDALALYERLRAAPLADRAEAGLQRVTDRLTPAH